MCRTTGCGVHLLEHNMSFRDATKPQYLGPDRLKPVTGTPILRASVEANRVSDLCTGAATPNGARERILAWLADGAREVTWALCSLPRERWVASPPCRGSAWGWRHQSGPARLADAARPPTRAGASGCDLEGCPVLGSCLAGRRIRTLC